MSDLTFSRQQVLDGIKDAATKLGRPPSLPEFTANSGIPKYYIARHFDGFRDALRSAGFQLKRSYTKQDVLNAINHAATKLGRPPSLPEFTGTSGIPKYYIAQHFDSFREAIHAAGLEPRVGGTKLTDDALLADWGEIVRRHHHVPTVEKYRREGHFSIKPFERRFGRWSEVPASFRDFARSRPEWDDVVALLPTPAQAGKAIAAMQVQPTATASKAAHTKQEVLNGIRQVAGQLGRAPSLPEFSARSGVPKYWVSRYFNGYREAVCAAGLKPNATGTKLGDDELLGDWARVVRGLRHIPTADQYRRQGKYSLKPFERHFGPWSRIPNRFREFARKHQGWDDVVALLPVPAPERNAAMAGDGDRFARVNASKRVHKRLEDRPTYGNPIDFRGLRHEPVNEQGVVFLFGMVAKEMGYMVEAVQTGYPDCEAKRQLAPGKWQRVRIEFEFESRNFDHPPAGCDVIVCWRHNWHECPSNIEVIELSREIKSLAKSDD
jgi:hypothetical protein